MKFEAREKMPALIYTLELNVEGLRWGGKPHQLRTAKASRAEPRITVVILLILLTATLSTGILGRVLVLCGCTKAFFLRWVQGSVVVR